MYTGPQQEAILILKSFAKESGLLEKVPSWGPAILRSPIEMIAHTKIFFFNAQALEISP